MPTLTISRNRVPTPARRHRIHLTQRASAIPNDASTLPPSTRPTTAGSAVAVSVAPAYQMTVVESLFAGAIARGAQILCTFPVDTVKTRVQATRAISAVSSSAGGSAAAAPSRIASLQLALRQGRLFAGVGVTLAGQVPYGMLTFGLYETIRAWLDRRVGNRKVPTWLRIVAAASIGDAVGSLWLTPSEVIKSKTQAGLYAGPASAVRDMMSNGGPRAFYQGYFAALARDVPFRAIQLLLYECCRRAYVRRCYNGREEMATPVDNLIVGAVSGSITAVATTPLDVVRTRMMSQPPGSAALYRSAWDCVLKTVRAEGLSAFLRGIGPRIVLVGPASAVFFLTYEATKSFFRARAMPRVGGKVAARVATVSPRRPKNLLRGCGGGVRFV